ncbi:MAG: hypothetical protein ACRYGH_38205 [Janthinobacterium lividum]
MAPVPATPARAPADSVATIAAIGLVAYVSADVAHHAFGHGAACIGLGCRLESLSSVFVHCSCTGATIDLAGPLANLLLGVGALGAVRLGPRLAASVRLLLLLTAAFNLFYFAGQLAVGAATKTDDWAWPLQQFHTPASIRYGLVAVGSSMYLGTMRLLAGQLAPFAWPRARLMTLLACAWAAAGLIACATAALDPQPLPAILYHAVPQALLLPLGLLGVPARAFRRATAASVAAVLPFSWPWVIAAVLVGLTSILVLGPGITF